MPMKNIENGFVAVFDILGYKSLIENNLITKTAELVSDFIEKTPALTQKALASRFEDKKLKEVSDSIGNLLKSYIISDTIVICLPFKLEKISDDFAKTIILMYFLSFEPFKKVM